MLPLLGFVGFSGVGKTTLLCEVIASLTHEQIRVALIKHAHHQFDIDYPGKDSYELRKAGAAQVIVASQKRWAMIVETPLAQGDPQLDQLLAQLQTDQLDLILVEGFKHVAFPKIELHRPELKQPLLCHSDENIIAVASNTDTLAQLDVPLLDINAPQSVCAFIKSQILEISA